MRDPKNSADCKTSAAKSARTKGFDVHHDILGWYCVAPGEDEPQDGFSLGFDGRPHFDFCRDAWSAADQHGSAVCRPLENQNV